MSASWSDIWQPVCVASGSWHQLVTHQLRHIIRRTLMSSITMWYLLHTEHTNQKLRHVQHTYTTYYILTASWNTQPAINIEQLSVNKLRSIKNSGWTLTVTVNLWKFNNRNTRPCNMRCSLPSYFFMNSLEYTTGTTNKQFFPNHNFFSNQFQFHFAQHFQVLNMSDDPEHRHHSHYGTSNWEKNTHHWRETCEVEEKHNHKDMTRTLSNIR